MSIVDVVSAISDDLVAKMAAAGLPPLTDGRIVIGRGKLGETSAPPRVVFIPTSFKFEARSNPANFARTTGTGAQGTGVRSLTVTRYGGGYTGTPTVTIGPPDVAGGTQATATAVVTSNGAISNIVPQVAGSGYLNPPAVAITGTGTGALATSTLQPTAPALAVAQQLAFATEWHRCEVHVWGVNSVNGVLAPNPELDYAATQQLYAQVIASAQFLFPGVHTESGGQWEDAKDSAMALDILGHSATFFLEVALPLLREPMVPTTGASVQYAPVPTQPTIAALMQPLYGGLAITGASNASPIQITTTAQHGLVSGTNLSIGGCLGNTAANGFWPITVVDVTNFTLNGSSGNGAYSGGGIVGPAGTALSG